MAIINLNAVGDGAKGDTAKTAVPDRTEGKPVRIERIFGSAGEVEKKKRFMPVWVQVIGGALLIALVWAFFTGRLHS